jgi:hypothetical protein
MSFRWRCGVDAVSSNMVRIDDVTSDISIYVFPQTTLVFLSINFFRPTTNILASPTGCDVITVALTWRRHLPSVE